MSSNHLSVTPADICFFSSIYKPALPSQWLVYSSTLVANENISLSNKLQILTEKYTLKSQILATYIQMEIQIQIQEDADAQVFGRAAIINFTSVLDQGRFNALSTLKL